MKNKNKILDTARRTIKIETETIQALQASINDDFCASVEIVFNAKGRLVLSGIGKSALVAQKIVATLNSTGTPSIFMHAADAIHGDLGMIRPEDVVMCISKSGETAEIKVLIPLLKNIGNKLIGMVSNTNSYLGKQADYILHTPVSKEADPNNLAPTASTTAQMVMGDALATSLLALRGFTPEDFAQFHPGGALGKQLYLRVYDLYPQNEKPSVKPDDNVKNIIVEMTSKRLGVAVVEDQAGKVAGIITDGDLRRMLEQGKQIDEVNAKDIMTLAPKVIEKNALAVNALQLMRSNSITQLVVVDEQEVYQGIIHLHDLIREGLI